MMMENGLSVITVKKTELLTALRKNREEHHKEFLEARQGYEKTVVDRLGKALADAKEGKEYVTDLGLEEPIDRSGDYDKRIRMLEMSVSDEIKITEQEFTQYVLDEWHWKGHFTSNAVAYKASIIEAGARR